MELLDAVTDDPSRLSEFALTFDGYAALAKKELYRLTRKTEADFHRTGKLPKSLAVLRACLFFEQRGFHHRGESMCGPYVDALVAQMRSCLSGNRS